MTESGGKDPCIKQSLLKNTTLKFRLQDFTFYTLKYLNRVIVCPLFGGLLVWEIASNIVYPRISVPISTGSRQNDNRFRESLKRGVKCIRASYALYDILHIHHKCKRRADFLIFHLLKCYLSPVRVICTYKWSGTTDLDLSIWNCTNRKRYPFNGYFQNASLIT